ncbi:MAG TPA: methyltransferase domain-containing protein [Micromonosporaceae bacterium]|nr:methyltransferase domain-containing protein [Micromonosporaceae bacterium]
MTTSVDTVAAGPPGAAGKLQRVIRNHYNGLVDLYEKLWGEHIHHGYWDPGQEGTDQRAAQLRTVSELVAFSGLRPGGRVLDAGCGVGAPALHLAGELGCHVEGITLSDGQVVRATEKALAAGLADRARFRQLDALATDYPDGSFDTVWALESLELMPDKKAFLTEALRVLRPGGTLAVTTWCIRDHAADPEEAQLLRRICRDFVVPYMLPLDEYRQVCGDLGYAQVRVADWSERVRWTWDVDPEVVASLTSDRQQVLELARVKGGAVLRLIHVVPLMREAYQRGVLVYGALRATKPAAGGGPAAT